MLKLNCLISICAESTANISKTWGFDCNHSFGNNFIYPTAGLTTCIMTIENLQNLAKKDFEEKDNIFSLIQNPISQKIISKINKEVEINYNLGIALANNVGKLGEVA
jgi:uncharacterized protein YdaL